MVVITISYDPETKSINVSGPTDKILMYGLMELAKEALSAQKPVETSPIVGPGLVRVK